MALILLRHTTPDIEAGVCYGRTDLDVKASFQQEAVTAFDALPRFEHIITSPLQRCRKLADFIAKIVQRPVKVDTRVIEMDFGRWEGMAWSDIPRHEIDAWANDFLYACPHGGESVAMLRDRTCEALRDISGENKPTLIVTHSGVIRAALAKGDRSEDFNASIDFGGHVTISDL
ncbi:MAG: alpha-ribazole phosphatase family protein [Pseudomonadota bacterium]